LAVTIRDNLERRIRDEAPPETVLAEEGEIDELKKLVGADGKLQSEAIKADTRRSEEEGTARDIFRELTGTTAWDRMAGLKPRLEDERRITELANEHAAVVENVTNCEIAVGLARERLTIAEEKLGQATAPTDPAQWLAIVDSISALGPVEKQAQTRQREVTAEEVRLADDFARFQPSALGVWTDAATVQVPSPETVAQFRKEFAEAERAIAKVSGELEQIDRDMATVRGQLVETAGAEPARRSQLRKRVLWRKLVSAAARLVGGLCARQPALDARK
jgi:hypothetical protein